MIMENVSKRGESRNLLMRKKQRNDTRTYLLKHQQKINTIQNQNQSMRDQLDAEKRQAILVNQTNKRQIRQLSTKGISYSKKIEIETKRQQDLYQAINQAHSMINARKSVVGKTMEGGSLQVLKNKIKKEEHYLDMMNGQMNGVIANNKIVIKKIDSLRKERSLFDVIYKQLETEICQKNKELLKTIILTDRTKEEKIKEHQSLEQLKLQAARDQRDFEFQYSHAFEELEQEQQLELQTILKSPKKKRKKSRKFTLAELEIMQQIEEEKEKERLKKEKWEKLQKRRQLEKLARLKIRAKRQREKLQKEQSKQKEQDKLNEKQTLMTQQKESEQKDGAQEEDQKDQDGEDQVDEGSDIKLVEGQNEDILSKDESYHDPKGETNLARIQDEIKQNNKMKKRVQIDTNMKNLNEIAEVFHSYKEKNQNLYDKCNKLSSEEIDLQQEISKMQKQLILMQAEYQGVDLLSQDLRKLDFASKEKEKEKIYYLQQDIVEIEKKNIALKIENKKDEDDTKLMFVGLQEAFTQLECNNEQNKYLATEDITKDNCLRFMDVICRRVNDIFLLDDFVNKEETMSEVESTDRLQPSSHRSKQSDAQNREQERQIQNILGNIEAELGGYKAVSKVQDPFDVKEIEKQLQQIMQASKNESKKKIQRKPGRKKTKFIY